MATTGWREHVLFALADGLPHVAGQVFASVSSAIPGHLATRVMARLRHSNVVRLSDLDDGRWRCFLDFLTTDLDLTVEGRGPRRMILANSLLRLRSAGICAVCNTAAFSKKRTKASGFCPQCRQTVRLLPTPVSPPPKRRMSAVEVLRWACTTTDHPDAMRVQEFIIYLSEIIERDYGCVLGQGLGKQVVGALISYGRSGTIPTPPPPGMPPPPRPKHIHSVTQWRHSRPCRVWRRHERRRVAQGYAFEIWRSALIRFCAEISTCKLETIEVDTTLKLLLKPSSLPQR